VEEDLSLDDIEVSESFCVVLIKDVLVGSDFLYYISVAEMEKNVVRSRR
jgi:hypothetical protein